MKGKYMQYIHEKISRETCRQLRIYTQNGKYHCIKQQLYNICIQALMLYVYLDGSLWWLTCYASTIFRPEHIFVRLI
jgi:hypothetical protein